MIRKYLRGFSNFQSHTGFHLAVAFANVLKEFGISDKVGQFLGRLSFKKDILELTTNQVLSITCDNASNKDVMIDRLETLLPDFSKVNHTRCFLHVNNLVARTLVRQFDVPKSLTAAQQANDDDLDLELRTLADDIDTEDRLTREALLNDVDGEDIGTDDAVEGWVDKMAALSQAEREVVEKSLRPVQTMLVKVRSTTQLTCKVPHFFFRSESSPSRQSIQRRFCCLHGQNVLKT